MLWNINGEWYSGFEEAKDLRKDISEDPILFSQGRGRLWWCHSHSYNKDKVHTKIGPSRGSRDLGTGHGANTPPPVLGGW